MLRMSSSQPSPWGREPVTQTETSPSRSTQCSRAPLRRERGGTSPKRLLARNCPMTSMSRAEPSPALRARAPSLVAARTSDCAAQNEMEYDGAPPESSAVRCRRNTPVTVIAVPSRAAALSAIRACVSGPGARAMTAPGATSENVGASRDPARAKRPRVLTARPS